MSRVTTAPGRGALLYEGINTRTGAVVRVGEFVTLDDDGKVCASRAAFQGDPF